MLDIKFIRENPDLIKEASRKKRIKFDIDALVKADEERKKILAKVEEKRQAQNEFSLKISSETNSTVKLDLIAKMKDLKEELQKEEEELRETMKTWQSLMVQVPNVPDISVPEGDSDEQNVEIKRWGEISPQNGPAKSHIEIMNNLGILDLDRGTKIAGFRGYVLKGDGALLSMAIWQYGMDFFSQKGFSPMLVPSLVRRENFFGTGYLPQSEEDLYKTQDGDFLAGTAEVPTMGYFSEEIINKEEFPKKVISFSPCFRREAGSHGKDVKGIFRVHEFYKLEQVVLCEASHEESVKYHEEINRNTEEFIESLGIPYRTVVNCGGDLGLGQVKKYDIELWVPSENKYREISSASYFHDFQTRRLNIRYKDADGKLRYAHSLNSTAVPTPRLLISLVENNLQGDGTVSIPEKLIPFMLGKKSITN